ncbi:hypothetical protein ACHAXR_011730 [Thalassiosira sp. AJA248-18]
MGDRNAEIWSTRLQREIVALESSDDDSKKMELLPPFIKTIGHTLNIEGGIAKIEFRIDVEMGEEARQNVDAATTPVGETVDTKEDTTATDAQEGDEGAEKGKDTADDKNEKVDDAADEKEKTVESAKDAQESEDTEPESKDETTKTATENVQQEKEEEIDYHVVLVLDASLYWIPDSSSQSSNPQCYPFQKPLAIVKSGCNLFSGGSTIQDGQEVDIDLDWTPSIHLSDAVTNVALKIRECVKRGEPLHPSKNEDDDDDEEGLSGSILREAREAKESLLEAKKVMGGMFSSGFSSLSAKGSSIAAKAKAESKSVSKGFLSLGESLSSFAEAGAKLGEDIDAEEEESKDDAPKEAVKKVVLKDIPDIGDEIDLSDEPWNQCIGMYSCKAIKRPAFIEAAMAKGSKNEKKEKEVRSEENWTGLSFAMGGGVSSASSMFSRFAQSAKSVMEESFLMVTEKSLIEFKSNKLNIGSGTVTFAIEISRMAKLKFRREESLSLFFKQASNDPLVYMCLDSAMAVQDIQNVLKRHGVKGKHTNAATQRAVQMALNLVALIQQKEKELIDSPTVDRVNEIMDLYRQAAEKFETAGDPRHAEVMAHMKRFLGQQFTTSILDGTFAKMVKKPDATSDEKKSAAPVPQGEILEQPTYNLSNDEDDDDDVIPEAVKKDTPIKETPDELNDSTMQNMEDMMNEAVKDMSDLGMEDDEINNILTSPPRKTSSKETDDLTDHDDTFAELDAMLSDADKELNELLNS